MIQSCPYCNGSIPHVEYSLGKLHLALMDEWLEEFNNNLDPYKCFPNDANTFPIWRCNDCGMIYRESICNRVQIISTCYNCNNTHNSKEMIELIYNEYADFKCTEEWIDLLGKVTKQWMCSSCGNMWQASPYNRLHHIIECPYCSGRLAIPGKTSFSALYPVLTIELHPDYNKDFDPDMILPDSRQMATWLCPEDGMTYF